MLEEIAAADYGMDHDAHLAALIDIHARDVLEGSMAWEPREGLELFHWSEFGENRTGSRERPTRDYHLMRAFYCAALLEAYADLKTRRVSMA